MVEVLKYFVKKINELEDQIKQLLNTNFGLRHTNKELIEKFKEINRLIDEDYFEDGSFNNEYYVKEILNEVLEGDKDGKN